MTETLRRRPVFESLESMRPLSGPTGAALPTAALTTNPIRMTGSIHGTYKQGSYDIAPQVRGIGWLSPLRRVGVSGFFWLRGPLSGADITLFPSRTTSVVLRIRDRLAPTGHAAMVDYTSIPGLWAEDVGSGNVEIKLTGTGTHGKFTAVFT